MVSNMMLAKQLDFLISIGWSEERQIFGSVCLTSASFN